MREQSFFEQTAELMRAQQAAEHGAAENSLKAQAAMDSVKTASSQAAHAEEIMALQFTNSTLLAQLLEQQSHASELEIATKLHAASGRITRISAEKAPAHEVFGKNSHQATSSTPSWRASTFRAPAESNHAAPGPALRVK